MRHLILGSSAAAVAAAAVLRKNKPHDEIIMASEDEIVHSRCLLYRYLSGERDAKSLDFTERNFFYNNNITLMPKSPATSLDIEKKTVNFESGSITYDKLLITTGAKCFIPDIPGLRRAKNVYTLSGIDDADKIKEAAKMSGLIVILGSGVIGMGIANSFVRSGWPRGSLVGWVNVADGTGYAGGLDPAIHVVETADRIVPTQLDYDVAKLYQERFEEKGVRFHLSRQTRAVTLYEDGRVAALEFEGRVMLPCDMVIVAAGNRPNTGFLEGSGIKLDKSLGNGVAVDKYLQTSAVDVYAAGDVTGITGNWYAAVKQGRVAAFNMTENVPGTPYEDEFHSSNSINYLGLTTVSVGKVVPPFEGCQVHEYQYAKKNLKLVTQGDLVVGALIHGDISNVGHWHHMIKNKIPLGHLTKDPVLAEYADYFEIDPNTAEFRYRTTENEYTGIYKNFIYENFTKN